MLTLPPKRFLLPNLFTLSATLCGFSAIWLSTQAESGSEFYAAASLICLAVFLDGFDGRIARWVDAQSKFGGQLDSFSDFLTFGVAPAILVHAWGLSQLGLAGLLVAFAFAACAMLRLARFNVNAEVHGGASRYFTGLPAPMAGLAIALLVGINAGIVGKATIDARAAASLASVMLLFGLLMVSNVPFRTFKDLRPTWRVRIFVATVLALQVIVSIQVDYMVALAMGLIGYLTFNAAGGLVSLGRMSRVRAHDDGTLIDDLDDEVDL
jgi:CDP-diacylglycerol--serine O-phosphatidyltransferase